MARRAWRRSSPSCDPPLAFSAASPMMQIGEALRAARAQARRGIELLSIASALGKGDGADTVVAWLLDYNEWCTKWEAFLGEFIVRNRKKVWTHERLRKARRSLNGLAREGALLAFVEIGQERGGKWRWPTAPSRASTRSRERCWDCIASRSSSGGTACTPNVPPIRFGDHTGYAC